MAESELVKKKRIRAGHKGSLKRILTEVKEMLGSPREHSARLGQQLQTLKEKRETVSKLDAEIMDGLEEDEIVDEIVQADVYREGIDMAILDIQDALSGLDIARKAGSQPANKETRVHQQQGDTVGHNFPSVPEASTTDPVPPTSSTPRAEATTPASDPQAQAQASVPSRAIGQVKLPKLSLRKFNGDLTSWTPFWESFKSSIHENNEITSVDKFNYPNSLLEGSAAAAIAGLTLSDANYNDAVNILTKRFGNRQQIVTKHMDALMGLEAVTSNHNLKGLRRLYDLVETHTRSLCSLGIPSTSYGSLLSSVVMNKLPQEIRVSISKEVTGESLDLEAIMKIVEREISARERATATVTVTSPVKKQPREGSVTASALLSNNSSIACSFCSQPHPSSDCGSVTDVGERKQILVKARRCYNCLKKGHIGRDCRSPSKCSNWRKTPFEHLSRPKTNGPQDATRASQQTVQNAAPTGQVRANNEPTGSNGRPSAVVSMYVSTKTPVLLQTASVRVKAPDKTTPVIQTRVLLDSGSQRSYISSKLCNQLGLKENSKETLLVKTFADDEGKVQVCSLVDLSVMTRGGLDMCLSLLSIPTICEPLTGQPINYATSRFQYLSGLDLADSSDGKDCLEVGVLIGVDQYWKIVTGKVVKGIAGPTAIETAFGWVLSGPVLGLTLEPTMTCLSTVHMMKVDASVCSAQQEIANLEMRLQAFWDLETLGIKESETSVYDNFMESVSFNNGRYCVRLPWK